MRARRAHYAADVMPSTLPHEVRQFIVEHVDSVEQLDVLVRLLEDPSREWTASQLAEALYGNERSIAKRLDDLADRELIVTRGGTPPRFQYGPRSSTDDAAIQLLAAVYGERHMAVVQAIMERPSATVRAFSDAFLIRQRTRRGRS